MSLPKFALGMISVIMAVVIWSIIDTASFSVTLVRAIICAVVVQIGYFLYVLGKVAVQTRAISKVAEPAQDVPAPKKDKLPLGRPLSR